MWCYTSVIPEVRAAHAGQYDAHNSVSLFFNDRIWLLTSFYFAYALKNCCFHYSFFFSLVVNQNVTYAIHPRDKPDVTHDGFLV